MEDNISNPLRFETNPYHNVIIKDRKVMELTALIPVSFCWRPHRDGW